MPTIVKASQVKSVPIHPKGTLDLSGAGDKVILRQQVKEVSMQAEVSCLGTALTPVTVESDSFRVAVANVSKQALIKIQQEDRYLTITNSRNHNRDSLRYQGDTQLQTMTYPSSGLIAEFDAGDLITTLQSVRLKPAHHMYRSADSPFVAIRAAQGKASVYGSDGVMLIMQQDLGFDSNPFYLCLQTGTWDSLHRFLQGRVRMYRRDFQYFFDCSTHLVSAPVEEMAAANLLTRFLAGEVEGGLVVHKKNFIPLLEMAREKKILRMLELRIEDRTFYLGTGDSELFVQYTFTGNPMGKVKELGGQEYEAEELFNPHNLKLNCCFNGALAHKLLDRIDSKYLLMEYQSKPLPTLVFSSTADEHSRYYLPTLIKGLV
ncbi:hypothetical protein ACFL54_08995 [Planctomycetota bacterium]